MSKFIYIINISFDKIDFVSLIYIYIFENGILCTYFVTVSNLY